jgi:hypothetical protein
MGSMGDLDRRLSTGRHEDTMAGSVERAHENLDVYGAVIDNENC